MNTRSTASQVFERRRQHSESVIDELRQRFNEVDSTHSIPGLTVFCAGSYGRLEANSASDVDIFFMVREPQEWQKQTSSAHHLFSDTIKILSDLGLPELTDDGLYLKIHRLPCVRNHLGAPYDDHSNQFTTRMLMLLEGRCLYGDEAYDASVADIIHSYYRDYPDHSQEFHPTFLINDISRFWKTLLLNYENKRHEDPDDRAKFRAKLRNYKLKFSRMTICYATIVSIATHDQAITENDLRELVQSTPFERLDFAVARVSEFASASQQQFVEEFSQQVADLKRQYGHFLNEMGKSDSDIEAMFRSRDEKVRLFGDAESYRSKMLSLLESVDQFDVHFKIGPALLI